MEQGEEEREGNGKEGVTEWIKKEGKEREG